MIIKSHSLPPAAVMARKWQGWENLWSLFVVKLLRDIPQDWALQMSPMARRYEESQTSIDGGEEPGGYTLEH
jgi:hypothetical protein